MARLDPRLLDPAKYPARFEITTRFADMDGQQHINNVAMAEAFEDTRVRFHELTGAYRIFGTLGSMVAANHIDYLAQARYPAPLVMFSGTLAVGRTSWTLAAIATQNGVPAAFSKAVMVAVEDGRPAPVPADMRAALLRYPVSLD